MSDSSLSATKCFFSYHRRDNDVYLRVVDRLKEELAGRFEASTGRQLQIFVDRDSIGWGEDWRTKIRESVLGATFFIPIVTMRYFTSDACIEELTTFYENAKQLGVADLVLPIVLAGSKQITSDHPMEEVRLVERLNFRPIEEQWAAGYESPQWIAIVNQMVDDLASALATAEDALSVREQSAAAEIDDAGETEADLDSLMEEVQLATANMQAAFEAMGTLGTVIQDTMSGTTSAPSNAQRSAVLIAGSRKIGAAATEFGREASAFQQTVAATDARVRAVVNELRSIDLPQAQEQLTALTASLHGIPDLTAHFASIDQAVGGLRVASMTNVSMRKALQPAIGALQSMRIGLTTVQSWVSV